jgi:hypothetical protein
MCSTPHHLYVLLKSYFFSDAYGSFLICHGNMFPGPVLGSENEEVSTIDMPYLDSTFYRVNNKQSFNYLHYLSKENRCCKVYIWKSSISVNK